MLELLRGCEIALYAYCFDNIDRSPDLECMAASARMGRPRTSAFASAARPTYGSYHMH